MGLEDHLCISLYCKIWCIILCDVSNYIGQNWLI